MRPRSALDACAATLLLAGLLAGCSTVITPNPVGDPVDAERLAEFEGVWDGPSGVSYVKAMDTGVLTVARVEWGDDGFSVETLEAVVTELSGQTFLHVSTDQFDGDDATGYVLMLISGPEDGFVVMHPPLVAAWRRAVEQGRLAGEVKDRHGVTVILDEPKDKVDDFVSGQEPGAWFDVSEPMVLRRLRDKTP